MGCRLALLVIGCVNAVVGVADADERSTYFSSSHVGSLRDAVRAQAWAQEELARLTGDGSHWRHAAFWTQLSAKRLAHLIPARPALPASDRCPKCNRRLSGQAGYDFARDPFRLVCPHCKTTFYEQQDAYPADYRFAEDRTLALTDLDGHEVKVPYRRQGRRVCFISNMIWSRRAAPAGPLATGLSRMTRVYLLGGDRAVGLRVVAMLDRLAEVYDRWPLWVADHAGGRARAATAADGKTPLARAELLAAAQALPQLVDAPPAWVRTGGPGAGRLTANLYDECRWLAILADAYAAVRATDLPEAYGRDRPGGGLDVRQRIEQHLFQPALALVRAHPPGKGLASLPWLRAAVRLAILFRRRRPGPAGRPTVAPRLVQHATGTTGCPPWDDGATGWSCWARWSRRLTCAGWPATTCTPSTRSCVRPWSGGSSCSRPRAACPRWTAIRPMARPRSNRPNWRWPWRRWPMATPRRPNACAGSAAATCPRRCSRASACCVRPVCSRATCPPRRRPPRSPSRSTWAVWGWPACAARPGRSRSRSTTGT